MRRTRIVWLGIVLAVLLAGGTAALNYWLRRPVDQALVSAVKRNDASMVRLLLLKGADPDTKDAAHLSLATWALLQDHADIAELLLDRGAHTDADFCLQDAIDNGRVTQIELLLKHGAKLSAVKLAPGTALLPMCALSGASLIGKLLDQGAAIDAQDAQGTNALMAAATAEDAEAVKLLLRRGANPNLQDGAGDTALIYACRGTIDPRVVLPILEALVTSGADPTIANKQGATPLQMLDAVRHSAAPDAYQQLALTLATCSSDRTIRAKAETQTFLYALAMKQPQLVTQLLQARADPNFRDDDADVPLLSAVRDMWGNDGDAAGEMAVALLKHGADPDLQDGSGKSARQSVETFLRTKPRDPRRKMFERLSKLMPPRHANQPTPVAARLGTSR